MKKFKLISSNQKIIAHMGSHTLYFMHSKWFSPVVNWLHSFMLKNYDLILCEGKMAEELVHSILGDKSPRTMYTFLGPPAERMEKLRCLKPNLSSKNILHISSGPKGFRTYYKGIMEMVKAFSIAHKANPDLTFIIVGNWSKEVISQAYDLLREDQKASLRFQGLVDDIEVYLEKSSLYLHCSNGDAFPTSSVEAMTSGVVPLVSNWTGTKQIVNEVHRNLVVEQNPDLIAKAICWYFGLDLHEKQNLSSKSRAAVKSYTEEQAITHYQQIFEKL